MSKENHLKCAITLGVCAVGDFVSNFLSTGKNLASERCAWYTTKTPMAYDTVLFAAFIHSLLLIEPRLYKSITNIIN